MRPLETVVRECEEEAGLPAPLVQAHVQAAGVLTYFYKTERGWRQPEMQYVYDLPLPPDVVLAPSDGEAESFELLDRASILERMHAGTFKPNCSLGTWRTHLTHSPAGLFYSAWMAHSGK
ncbi:thiamine diphosphokinase [Malassezia nana]|uniref:Thiamine diphosphokinase n=1 Tax=Malassezia nana TaxID=180528 RepID=A0AAF0EKI2_9BASI|nr:thiamine diphosphokinase [Malassezia nana]